MRKLLDSFFLAGYENDSYFEKKKARYLSYIIITSIVVATAILVGQYAIGMGPIYTTGNIITLIGVIISALLFRKKQTETAGHVMVMSALIMTICQNIFRDVFSHDPAMRYLIYLDMASLMGTYFLIVAFFRQKKVIYLYAVTFEIILTTHALVLYFNLNHIPGMAVLVLEHYATVFCGVIVIACISSWLLSYLSALWAQNTEYSKLIEAQKGQLEEMINFRTKALVRSNENLREFAHIVSHDLKEPLRTISGFVSLISKELERQGWNDEQIEEYIQYVRSGTYQMERLISDILAYSKLNVMDRQSENVDMHELINEVKSVLAKAIYESEGHIHVANSIQVSGEKRLLLQLFQNLISNAIKYRAEEKELNITVGCSEDKGSVTYFVQDNGIGIAPEYHETIFHAFKRLHSKMDYEGTGVGLAICKKIVEIHGGKIWVESCEGEGSTFYFTLPKAQTEVPAINPVVHAA